MSHIPLVVSMGIGIALSGCGFMLIGMGLDILKDVLNKRKPTADEELILANYRKIMESRGYENFTSFNSDQVVRMLSAVIKFKKAQ